MFFEFSGKDVRDIFSEVSGKISYQIR